MTIQITPPTKTRITAIDTLRGFALLGILIMNIQGFAMVAAAYGNPALHMDLTGVNWAIWVFGHIFADMKFMAIFSMLFGAGIVMFTARRDMAGQSVWRVHYARNFWLLIFGLIHAYLIWYGDILVTYAICGFWVYWLRHMAPGKLVVIGAVLLCIPPVLMIATGAFTPPDIMDDIIAESLPNTAQITAEIEAYRGAWADGFGARFETVLGMHITAVPFFLIWRAGGLMFIGMALFKLGILSAQRSPRFYKGMVLLGFAIGLPLAVISVIINSNANWHPTYTQFGLGMMFNYVGSIAMALAYIGGVMWCAIAGIARPLQARLAAVGQMAFTNYILHSVICTFIFYGFGLGLFGAVERWAQMAVVVAIWAVQLILSPIWLRHFKFGPLEWAWRSLTYMRPQKMRV